VFEVPPDTRNQLVLHQDQVISNQYQQFYNDAWDRVVEQFNNGQITIGPGQNWQTVLG
jgi:hypothetical protein